MISNSKDIAFAELGDTYEPRLHRLQQAIRHRAVHENKPIPPPFEMIIKFMHPPREILNNSALSWKNVQNAADIKKGKLSSGIYAMLLIIYQSPPKDHVS